MGSLGHSAGRRPYYRVVLSSGGGDIHQVEVAVTIVKEGGHLAPFPFACGARQRQSVACHFAQRYPLGVPGCLQMARFQPIGAFVGLQQAIAV